MFALPLLGFRRVRDKYESELKELEESERNMQEKYNNMKVRARSGAFSFHVGDIHLPPY